MASGYREMKVAWVVVLGLAAPAEALRLNTACRRSVQRFVQNGQSAIAAAACASCLLAGQASAVTVPEAIVETSEAAYPVLKALPKDSFPQFAEKVGALFLGFKPDKLAKATDLAIDVYLSVPAEKVDAFNSALKEAYGGLKPGDCDLVPLPPPSLVKSFTSSEAFGKVDPEKLKAFDAKWGATLAALPKTDEAICLPATAEKLDKLALAQAEVGRAFGADESKAFGTYFGGVAKASITPAKAFPLLGDAQKQTMGASLPERQAFKAAGKKLEEAAKLCQALPKKCGFD